MISFKTNIVADTDIGNWEYRNFTRNFENVKYFFMTLLVVTKNVAQLLLFQDALR